MGKVQTLYVVTILLLASVSGAGLGSVSAAGNADGGAGNSLGQLVSSFVHGLQSSGNTSGGIGGVVADFVLTHNPAAAMTLDHAGQPADREPGPPDHAMAGAGNMAAGPPTDVGSADGERGPPADAPGNQGERDHRGPPIDAGPPGQDDDRGPPSDAGPPNAADADELSTPTETDDESGTSANGESSSDGGGPPDDRGGPPDDAGPPQ